MLWDFTCGTEQRGRCGDSRLHSALAKPLKKDHIMTKKTWATIVTGVTLALLGIACDGGGENGGPITDDPPSGKVTSIGYDNGAHTTFKVCVRAAYDDSGFKKGEVYCRGNRDVKDNILYACRAGQLWPECSKQ
jgi:hypothetical protein